MMWARLLIAYLVLVVLACIPKRCTPTEPEEGAQPKDCTPPACYPDIKPGAP